MQEIIVEVGMQYTRTALIEDGDLIEFLVEENQQQSVVGNIYKGLVQKVIPGLGAAFIDIGEEKNAYLSLTEKEPVFLNKGICLATLKNGEAITVQAIKEATETKGITVTTHISLPGKFFVMVSDDEEIHISQKIKEEEERKRLLQMVQEHKKENHGVIIRTEAQGKSKEELVQDYLSLQKQWNNILKKEPYAMPKTKIHKEVSTGLKNVRERLTENVNAYQINNMDLYKEVKEFISQVFPTFIDKIKYTKEDLFSKYQIESKVLKALRPKVWLKSGGFLVIEETEALTVIDVNSGKFVGKKNVEDTILKTNMEAIKEIAKQVRLRNLSGIIIIDFIDMQQKTHQQKVLHELQKVFTNDPVPVYIIGMTNLGLVEITRKKIKNSLSDQLLQSCSYCYGGKQYGKAFLIPQIEREIQSIIRNTSADEILLEGSKEIIDAFIPYQNQFTKLLRLKNNFQKSMIEYKVSPIFYEENI